MKSLRHLALVTFSFFAACQCERPRIVEVSDSGCLAAEICFNELDDTCDGQVDEGCECVDGATSECGESEGACAPGLRTCSANRWGPCVGAVGATEEVCDAIDNDCDGQLDEDLTRACGTSVGTCREGTQTCTEGDWGACEGELAPGVELCEARLDENCDGTVDEGCDCSIGERRACGSDAGTCVPGMQDCGATGQWLSCVGATQPVTEACDHLDNDCDGATDEDGVCLPPRVMCPAAMMVTTGTPANLTGTATVASRPLVSLEWTVTTQPSGSAASPVPASGATVQFAPDLPGDYRLSFCATDDFGEAACCETDVTSGGCNAPPAPQINIACEVSWDGRPIVQFSPVPAGLTYELSQPPFNVPLGTAVAGQNHLRPASRINAGGAYPGDTIPLVVRACRVSEPSCCSVSAITTVDVIEECTVPVSPTATNIVLSEYVVNGDGACPSADCLTQDTCQAGEAIEISNLSNCPVSLSGFHFAYRNANASAGSYRWMNFGAADLVPPRGVYVAIRNEQFSPTCGASLGVERPGLFGLKVSALTMQGSNLCSGWFNNTGGGQSELRVAPGTVTTAPTFTPSAAITRIAPYLPASGTFPACTGSGFDAVVSCSYVGGPLPTSILSPNQLGRLWHPCDSVASPNPACIRD